jgi:hypothetical protein
MIDWLKRWGLWLALGGASLAAFLFVVLGRHRAALAADLLIRGALARAETKRLLNERQKVLTDATRDVTEVAALDQLVKTKQAEIERLAKGVGGMTDDMVEEGLRARGLIR